MTDSAEARLAAALAAYAAYVNCQHDDDARCEHWKAALEAERAMPDTPTLAADLALAAAVRAIPRTSVVIFWQAGDVTVLSNMGGDGGSYNAPTLTAALEASE